MKLERKPHHRLGGLLVILIVALAGCGGGGAPGGKPAAQSAADRGPVFEPGSTKPISARDAALIIDLRTFPRLAGADVQSARLGEVNYKAPGTMKEAVDFCVKKLTEAGWREPPDERRTSKAGETEYQYLVFGKQGHLLNATIMPQDQGILVHITNSGNFDTRTLPRMKDATLQAAGSSSFPIYTSTNYTTGASVNEVIDFMAKEMLALGWQEYVPHMASSRRQQGSLHFRNRGTSLAVYAYKDREQADKTSVSYSASLLTDEIPTMPDAVSLRLEDGTLFQLRYDTAAEYQPVIDFYKKELPQLGWKYREGAGLFQKEHTFFFFDGDNKHYLSVDLKPAAGGKTMVSFLHLSPEIEEAFTRKSKEPPKTDTKPAPVAPGDLVDAAAEAAIKKLGGSIHRDKQSPGQPIIVVQLGLSRCQDADLKMLTELKSLWSVTLYKTAVTDAGLKELAAVKKLASLDLGSTKITDDGLKELAGLTALEQLTLNGTQITGAGLADLAGLKKLRTLFLSDSQLTDDGLKGVGQLVSLHMLDLSGTKTTGSGLKELARLKSLQILNLNATAITDSGLTGLPKWPELQSLSLYRTAVTDAGLKGLAGLPSLERLTLSNTSVTGSGLKELTARKMLQHLELNSAKVTDEGLKGLAGFTGLEDLDLGRNKEITDAGLQELYKLTSLRSVNLAKTKVSPEGIDKLKKALPECKIRN